MSFLDYLKDNRGQFVDHRGSAPTGPGRSALEIELLDLPEDGVTATASTASASRRRRRARSAPSNIRFRHVRPAYAPLPYSDPLPYEEPWERAFR